ncbi:MAG: 2'-5' RNA ligase family protein [Actinobacteria bacterium]|nr:2'-5' RNA ligase family protein [Actinomycetota bacterium]
MAGISALQLAVSAVDPLLDDLRTMVPAGSAVLEPAHISFGYPWMEPSAGRAVIDDVAEALAREAPFDIELAGPRRFDPDPKGRVTVWLEPYPAAAIHALNWVIADASGHDVDDFTPHCSLVRLQAGIEPGPLERLVHQRLPLRARLDRVEFHTRDDDVWRLERSLPLGSTPA